MSSGLLDYLTDTNFQEDSRQDHKREATDWRYLTIALDDREEDRVEGNSSSQNQVEEKVKQHLPLTIQTPPAFCPSTQYRSTPMVAA